MLHKLYGSTHSLQQVYINISRCEKIKVGKIYKNRQPGSGQLLRAKKGLFMQFFLISGHFWCSEVTSVTFSSNLSDLYVKNKKQKNGTKSEYLNFFQKSKKNKSHIFQNV